MSGFTRLYPNTSLFEGIVTESENTEMNKDEDILKEVLSSTALTSHDWYNAQESDGDIRFISEALEKEEMTSSLKR